MKANMVCASGIGLLLAVAGSAAAAESTVADAAKHQDRTAVRAFVEKGADVNAALPDGATALHWAAHWDDLELADLLIKARANVNVVNDYDVTPLSLASENGSLAMVERLLKAGANANAATSTGETPLMTAIRAGNLPVVQALVGAGADVNAKEGSRQQTPLMWAVARQQHEIVRVLIDHGADVLARSRVRPEYVSFARGDPQGGRLRGAADGTFTSDGTRPGVGWTQKGGLTPLLFAAQQGDPESAKLLVASGANVNDITESGNTALMMAALNDNGEVARFLLDTGADPNATKAGYTALHLAVVRQDLDLVKALLARQANPNVQLTKGTPKTDDLSGKFSLLPEYLLGATPYLLASALNEVDMMRVLIPAGANPLLSMKDGTTPLIAALGINPGVLGLQPFRRVAKRGAGGDAGDADADAGGGGGAGYGRRGAKADASLILETVRLNIEVGVDVNAARVGGVVYHGANPRTKFGRDDGDTALHTATVDKLTDVVDLLVSRGARMDLKNNRGLTPLGLATSTLRQYQNGYDGAKVADEGMAAQLRKLGATE